MAKIYVPSTCIKCGEPRWPFHLHYKDRMTPVEGYTCQRCREAWHGHRPGKGVINARPLSPRTLERREQRRRAKARGQGA